MTFIPKLFGQSNQCDLLKVASISYCKQDYQTTLDNLLKFRKAFKSHALIEEVNQQIAHLYYLTNDIATAKTELENVLVGKNTGQSNDEYEALECKTNYDSSNFDCMRIVFPEPYIHLQHWAALDLYQIYLKENNFEKALTYLKAADNKYAFNYWCGNGNTQKSIEIALQYGQLYEKMGKPDSALMELLPLSFENYLADNSEVTNMTVAIIKKYHKITEAKTQLDNAIDNLLLEEVKSKTGKTYLNYSINFMNTKIKLAYPDWTENEFTKTDVQKKLRNSLLYKQLSK